jgi:integrase
MQSTDTVRSLLDRYLNENLIAYDVKTRGKYEVAIRRLERTLGEEATLSHLTNSHLARMMGDMDRQGRSRPTTNGYRAKLVALWTWACKQGWLQTWPSVKKLPESRRSPVAWSANEIGILWRSLDAIPGFVGGIRAPLWWKAYLLTAWDTGERHSARLAMEWHHFTDWDQGRGVIPAEVRKGRSADLPFSLHRDTMTILQKIRSLDAERPLPWPYSECLFWIRFRKVLKRAGLPSTSKHMSHCLRRSVATHLVRGGADRASVSGVLGQKDLTVIDLYLDGTMLPGTIPHERLFRPWDA